MEFRRGSSCTSAWQLPVPRYPAIVRLSASGFRTGRSSCHSDRCCSVITFEDRGFDALDELGHPVVVRYRHQFSTGGLFRQRRPAVVDFRSAYHSVGAVVRWRVRRIIGATEAIVVNATKEMTPSNAKVPLVDMRHATRAKAVDVASAETSDATAAQATHGTAANAANTGADVTSAKAAHAPTVSSAAAAAAPSLRARGKKAAGKHC